MIMAPELPHWLRRAGRSGASTTPLIVAQGRWLLEVPV
jgi:hypothetical protein